MTVNANPRRAGPFIGTGLIVALPFDFKVFEDTDLLIVRAELATGITTDLVIDSDYSVTLNPDQENNPGGTVSYLVGGVPTALPVTQSLTIVGNLPFTQPIDITNQGGFYPEVIEDGLDRVTMLIQQNEDSVSRSLQLSVATDQSFDVQMPAPVAGNFLGWSLDGLSLANYDGTQSAPVVAAALAQLIANLGDMSNPLYGSALVGRSAQVVNSIATLKTLLKTSKSVHAFVTGYYAAGDGGGGVYYYDAADTTTADNGGTVIVAADGGRWKLVHQGSFTPDQFGARGDGATNDSAAIQAAHNAAVSSGAVVRLDQRKKYALSSTITATGNFRFRGFVDTARGGKNNPFADLAAPVIVWTGGNSTPIFSVDHYISQHTEIEGIAFNLPSGYTTNAIVLKGGPFFTTGGVQSCYIEGLGFYRQGAISCQATNAIGVYVDCTGALTDGRTAAGWSIRNLFAFNMLSLIKVEVANNTFGTPGLDNWFNSNVAEDLYGYQVYRLIHLVSGTTNGNAIWRNTLRNCTNQPGKGLDTLYATGACVFSSGTLVQYNHLDHCTAWDLTSGSEFVLPETNMRRGFFGDAFSHTEGLLMYGPTASEQIRMRRPGWNTAYHMRSQGNDGGRFMLSNNWDGFTRDDATAPVAAITLHAETGVPSAIRFMLGNGGTEQYLFQDGGTVVLKGLPTAAPATSGQLWRDAAAGHVIKMVP